MRKSIVYINVNNLRKKFFFAIQQTRIEAKRSSKKIKTMNNDERKRLMRQRSLKLFQNVNNRWNFTCHMLIRAYVLREDLNKFFHDYHDQYFQLTSKEWDHVEYLIEIVKSFCVYTKILNTTIILIIHQIFNIYNSLFDHLDKAKARLRRKRVSWKKKLVVAIDFVDLMSTIASTTLSALGGKMWKTWNTRDLYC